MGQGTIQGADRKADAREQGLLQHAQSVQLELRPIHSVCPPTPTPDIELFPLRFSQEIAACPGDPLDCGVACTAG